MKNLSIHKSICIFITLLSINITYADFILQHSEHLDIMTSHTQGQMYDTSTAHILLATGIVTNLYMYNFSETHAYFNSQFQIFGHT